MMKLIIGLLPNDLTHQIVTNSIYSYDTAGRLASLVNPFSETTSFVYDTLGRVGQKTLANGTSEHYAYDTRSRLTQVQLKQGATVLRTTGYAWDNADQITNPTPTPAP